MKAILFATAVLVLAGSANALTIVQTLNISSSATDFSAPATFNYFNGALGTLTGVTTSLHTDFQSGGSLKNTSGVAQSFKFKEGTDITLSGGPAPLNSAQLTDSFSNSQSYTLAAGGSGVYGPFSQSQTATYVAAASDLAAFINSGTFDTSFITSSGETFLGGGGNITSALNTTVGGVETITYNYDPAGVPEPTSWALMIVGFGLAGASMRRRARVAA